MLPDELKMVRARKVVDNGTGPFAVPLAQLTESILINESLSKLTKAVEAIEIPEPQEIEIPEYPTEITVSNLPEIQRVEIVNPPKDKDDKEQLKLLKQIAEELKKKEQYTYDIEVDSNLKEQLRGEQGTQGPSGSPDTGEEIKAKLEGLEGEERLDASAIKNLDSYVKENSVAKGWTRGVKTVTGGTGVTVDNTDPYNPILSASSGSGDVVGPTGATADAIARYDTTTGKLIKDSGITIADGATGVLSGTNTGDQLMYGTIAVTGQSDLDPTGTGDTLNVEAGANVTITTAPLTNTLTIEANVPTEDSFGIVVDGAGTAITTGSKGVRYIPFDCTVTGWDIRSDISGSCVFDVKRSGVSLAGTEKPTLTASTSNQDLTLSTWTTSLLTGDVVEFVVDSASTLTRATLTILVTKL